MILLHQGVDFIENSMWNFGRPLIKERVSKY